MASDIILDENSIELQAEQVRFSESRTRIELPSPQSEIVGETNGQGSKFRLIGQGRLNLGKEGLGDGLLQVEGRSGDASFVTPGFVRSDAIRAGSELTVGTPEGGELEQKPGSLEVLGADGEPTVAVDGDSGEIRLGGSLQFKADTGPLMFVLEDEEEAGAGSSTGGIFPGSGGIPGSGVVPGDSVPAFPPIELTEEARRRIDQARGQEDRVVVARSPKTKDWGLVYRDKIDAMIFQSAGDPVLSIDLFSKRVGVNVDEPSHELHVDGTVASRQTVNLSDARCKEDIAALTGALEKVLRLRGISFRWKNETGCAEAKTPGQRQLGLIAQEVREVLPEVVVEDEHGLQSVAYNGIVPVLVEGMKEQQQQIDGLRAELDEMRRLVANQQRALRELKQDLSAPVAAD